jgi:hypothetical protein
MDLIVKQYERRCSCASMRPQHTVHPEHKKPLTHKTCQGSALRQLLIYPKIPLNECLLKFGYFPVEDRGVMRLVFKFFMFNLKFPGFIP